MKAKKIVPVSKKLAAKAAGPSVLLADLRAMEPFILELGAGFVFVDRQKGEESPIGLILCAGKRQETVELLNLGRSGIQVSAYFTKTLPKDLLERKLHEALVLARARLERLVEPK